MKYQAYTTNLDITGAGILNLVKVDTSSANNNISVTIEVDGVSNVLSLTNQNVMAGTANREVYNVNGSHLCLFMPLEIHFKTSLKVIPSSIAIVEYTLT